MTCRVVRLPSGKQVGLDAYVRAWKILRNTPGEVEVTGWNWYPTKAADVLRELRRGMHDRINRHVETRGRKHDPDWQRHLRLLAGRINTPRLRVYATELGEHGWLVGRMPNRFSVIGD